MNILIAFGVAGLVGFGSYVLGLRRGIKIGKEESCEEYKNAYWEGYNDGRLDPASHIVGEAYEEGFQDGKKAMRKELELPDPWHPEEENKPTKLELINEVVAQVGELFEGDDDNVIDGGQY